MGIFKASKGLMFLLFLVLTACDIINPEEPIPSYLYIEKPSLETNLVSQGTASHNFVDMWVGYQGNLIGVHSLPALIPIIADKGKTITFQAGIKENGLSTTRVKYPFIDALNLDGNLIPGVVDTFKTSDLVFKYKDNTRFLWLEDFEGSSIGIEALNNNFNNFAVTREKSEIFEGKGSLKIQLNKKDSAFAIQTFNEFNFGDFNFGSPTFLEINYKCDVPILVGYLINTPNGSSVLTSGDVYMVINSSPGEWKKMYINLTEKLALITEGQTARVYFQSYLLADDNGNFVDANVFIDNLKLVTFE